MLTCILEYARVNAYVCSQVRADAIVDDERQQVAHNTVAQICLSRSVRQSLCSGTCMCVCVSLSLSLSLSHTHPSVCHQCIFHACTCARTHTHTHPHADTNVQVQAESAALFLVNQTAEELILMVSFCRCICAVVLERI